jgi:hypothetical protein
MIFNLEGMTLLNLFKKPGVQKLFKNALQLRLETPELVKYELDFEDFEQTFFWLDKFTGPKKSSLKRRQLVYLFSYHVIRNYRGWRYIRNLPINGQRTWSNAWTAHRCNTLLKPIILKRGRSFYGNLQSSEIYTAYLAEYVNKKWKENWNADWTYARSIRLFNKKKKKRLIKIDLYSMARGHVITERRLSKLTKKQRAQHNLNHYSLGFTPGFTISLLRRLFKMRALISNRYTKMSKLILNKGDMKERRTKKPKKKVDEKARLAAHAARKKAKKK